MVEHFAKRRAFCVALILSIGSVTAFAGEVEVSWNPSQDATGYRVYTGPSSGQYTDSTDVGNTTSATIALDDCTMSYIAATAYNAVGESGPSNEAATWPRAVLASASPATAEQGSQVTVTVGGINFRGGDLLTFSNPGIQIDGVSVDSCNQMTLMLTVAQDAALGAVDLTVTHPSGVAGLGAGLLTIEPWVDDEPPVITGVGVSGVTGTAAVIDWTTDEPADGTVYYREQGDGTYLTVPGDDAVTSHSVALTGLEPDTTYEFHVSSTDASGNTTTTSPDDTFTTDPSPYSYIRFEGESGVLTTPVRTTSGADAFGGAWIDTPNGSGQGTASDPLGTATFGVNLPDGGTWYVWVRMYAPDSSSNSWFESIDGAQRVEISTTDYDVWTWVPGTAYDLDAGLHTVELGGRERTARIDRVLLTDDPAFVPTEQPGADVTPPGQVADFTAVTNGAEVDLTWTAPADADLDRIVIRYRTDGFYPTSPADGMPLVDQPATPGSLGSYTHDGLQPETTYSYSAFAVDDAGNVSLAVHALGAVAGVPPPPQSLNVY